MHWHSLGTLISNHDKQPGIVFVPRVVFSQAHRRYVMWFENYNQSHGPPDPHHPVPTKGLYAVAVSDHPAGPFTVIRDGPGNAAKFACSGTQGDFDLFTDRDGTAYLIVTYYSHFCIEELNPSATGGTGKTTTIVAQDTLIKGHPDGDEAPAMFRRGDTYYVTYASGCCGCKGGSVTWAWSASHPLGPWVLQGSLTPGGPVTKAQQRAVFRVPKPGARSGTDADFNYIHLGNNWVPGAGGAGTCTNQGLLYWWPLQFHPNGSIAEIRWKDRVSFEMEPQMPAAPAAAWPPRVG